MTRVRRREGIVVGASVVNMGLFYHAQSATIRDEEDPHIEDERPFRSGGDGGGPSTLCSQAEGGDCCLNLGHQQFFSWEIADFPISENIVTQYALSSPHH
ncbi:MAG: hypothetical protein NZ842_18610 [Dehalococcoidia bacterium]|nr:hypothetical protein [Dehalococcoidia bacterium]